jgi:predicted ATPase
MKKMNRSRSPFLRSFDFRQTNAPNHYPFNLPVLRYFNTKIEIEEPITIFTGVNGSGKSTLIEALAHAAGFDLAGGGVGHKPVDHSETIEITGAALSEYIKMSWQPRVNTGWFFRAETFHSVAGYLDRAALSVGAAPPNYLAASHGEGFIEFFEERLKYRGIYFLDEPESAVAPSRQRELVQIVQCAAHAGTGQFFIATHSPIIMSAAGGEVLDFGHRGIIKKTFRDTEAYQAFAEFFRTDEHG